MRHSQPPAPTGLPTEPVRPSCAIALNSAIQEDDAEVRGKLLASANEHALKATPEMCANCLGRPAVEIICPLPSPQHPQQERFKLSLEKFNRLVENLAISSLWRFTRLLTNERVSSGHVYDPMIRRVLHYEGIPQIGNLGPNVDYPELPTIDTVPDPRDKMDIENEKKKDEPDEERILVEAVLEEAIMQGDTVPDPRGLLSRPIFESEARRACAKLLAQALKERRETREFWKAQNLPLAQGSRHMIDHSANEKTYRRAVSLTGSATKEDCDSCLKRDICPLTNQVEFKRLSDTTNRMSEVENGVEIRTQDVMVEILKGKPRTLFTIEILEALDRKLRKRAEEARAA